MCSVHVKALDRVFVYVRLNCTLSPSVDLFLMYTVVRRLGGYNKVTPSQSWHSMKSQSAI